jgi:integrase
MAKVVRLTWTSRGPLGGKVKHVAFGYTLYRPDRTRERKVGWATEQAAVAALHDRLAKLAAGDLARPVDKTFGAVIDEYLTYKRPGKASIHDDERILRRAFGPAFGVGTRVRAITGAMIAQYERARSEQVSPYTVSHELSVLRHCLRLARRWGYLDVVPDFTMPRWPEGRTRYLDADEILRLMAACRESRNPYLATIVTLALYTGMRQGEILGLEWDRIDLSTARITLLRTKARKPRGIPFGREVYDALIALQPDSAQRQGRLFRIGRRGSQIRTAWEVALRRAKITAFRFNDLRHTTASHLLMRGAGLKDVQEILGHADLRMTLRYAHLSPAHLRGAIARLDGLTTGAPAPAAIPAPVPEDVGQINGQIG